jgi:uncharacterized protein (DUF849 family)
MYFTDDSLLPENQDPLIITAAPYGPFWIPGDFPEDIPLSWDDQVQKAVDCYNAGATILHIHVRDPKTGKISKKLSEYNYLIERLRKAVPKLILQVGGSISLAPEGDGKATWQDYDTRHLLTEISPKPDQITVAIGSCAMDLTAAMTPDDFAGTHMMEPKVAWAYAQLVNDATPEFYIEHLKRLRQVGIQAYFALAHVHQQETIERLIRQGLYLGPVNGFTAMGTGGSMGFNPFDLMEYIRRSPQGSVWTYTAMQRQGWAIKNMCMALGQHVRVGIEECIWDAKKGVRMTTVQQIEKAVRMSRELGREIATGDDAHRISKLGVMYASVEDTLLNLGLPPNRKEGEQGFRGYGSLTTGKLASANNTMGQEAPTL